MFQTFFYEICKQFVLRQKIVIFRFSDFQVFRFSSFQILSFSDSNIMQ